MAKSQGPDCTLSPLARPGKAVALEARIELWSASDRPLAFQLLKTNRCCDERFQLSTDGHSFRLDGNGAGCHEAFLPGAGGWRGGVSLDIPFHRTPPACRRIPGRLPRLSSLHASGVQVLSRLNVRKRYLRDDLQTIRLQRDQFARVIAQDPHRVNIQ